MTDVEFLTLYREHHHRVLAFHRARNDPQDAEDLTGDTFTRAWRSRAAVVDQGAGYGPWLITIAANLGRDHRRHLTVVHRWEVLTDTVPDTMSPSAESVVLTTELHADIRAAVNLLPASQRDCVLHRIVMEHSREETAVAMGRSLGSVIGLQQRGIQALRGMLTDAS